MRRSSGRTGTAHPAAEFCAIRCPPRNDTCWSRRNMFSHTPGRFLDPAELLDAGVRGLLTRSLGGGADRSPQRTDIC